MRLLFADSGYWVALLSPKDDFHLRAVQVSKSLHHPYRIITSEMIFAEVLAAYREDPYLRKLATAAVKNMIDNPIIEVVPQTRRLFQEAFELYAARPDKSWSLTDCASFEIMRRRKITEALAHDQHFQQASFVALLRE